MKILITGCAGFIGSHLCDSLLGTNKFNVIGIDNFNNYYDPKIKEGNLRKALNFKNFKLYRVDILEKSKISDILKKEEPQKIVHLAARAGVRGSIENPKLYAEVNVLGTTNLLKLAVDSKVEQFIFGSSSSVYGNTNRLPFLENDACEKIISPYGSSKRAAEFFVESFHRTHGLRSIILRLFTVYGPRGRPDMAPALFTKAIIEGQIIYKFGEGLSSRDYTYIDDIIEGIVKALNKEINYEVINLGNNNPVTLNEFIKIIEKLTGKKAKIKKHPPQNGDVEKTWANVVKAKEFLGWEPKTKLEVGLRDYIQWLENPR